MLLNIIVIVEFRWFAVIINQRRMDCIYHIVLLFGTWERYKDSNLGNRYSEIGWNSLWIGLRIFIWICSSFNMMYDRDDWDTFQYQSSTEHSIFMTLIDDSWRFYFIRNNKTSGEASYKSFLYISKNIDYNQD